MELVEGPANKKVCEQCNREKDLEEFYRTKNGRDGRMKLCAECHSGNLRARREEEERRRQEEKERARAEQERLDRERREAIEREEREREERRARERQAWIEKEPERQCIDCQQRFPIAHFMFYPFEPLNPKFSLHSTHPFQRCPECHAAMRDARLVPCCICQQKISQPMREFDGFRVDRDGLTLAICCKACMPTFLTLSPAKQRFYIQSRCKHHFRPGQLIYIQSDPRTQEVRYVGRTYHMARRQREHLNLSFPYDPTEIDGIKQSYTRANWTYDLLQLMLAPQPAVIYHVDLAPRVVEWEQRYICHYIRQGAPLLNTQARDTVLYQRIQATALDFLTAPFESLVEEGFFEPDHIEAFIHKWHS